MRVLLCTSPHLNHAAYQEGVVPLGDDRRKLAQTFAPMGLLSLAGAIHEVADVEIADINKAINQRLLPMSPDFYDSTALWLLQKDPDVLGFMTEADSYHHLLRICAAVKARSPGALTLLGGPHASAVDAETLEFFPAIDFVIRGEGEPPLAELVEALKDAKSLESIGNLTYRSLDRVVANPARSLIANLDDLPWPDLSRIDFADDDAIFVEIGRGCPFRCNFCFTAPYWQRRHRIKSPARIMRELAYLKGTYGRTDFNFTHDLFTTNRRWVIDFCRQLAASDLGVTWTCSSRTDTLDEEQIYWLQQAGCRNIYFGVESGTAEMQRRIDKNLDLAEARSIIGKTSEAGIGLTVGFIAGLPGESAASLRGTLMEGLHYLGLPDAVVHLFGFSPYRGSANYEWIKDDIDFDRHFVDFPLGPQTHAANCQMMESNLSTFSRYAWMRTYAGLDHSVVRAAEEFFPLVNALRPLLLALRERALDPLSLLTAWAQWIGQRNQAAGRGPAGLYRGTIAEFLSFLSLYLPTKGANDPILKEMLRWETLKSRLREADGLPPDTERSPAPIGELLIANPSVVTEQFEFAPSFHADSEPTPATFAFYRRRDGSPSITRVGSLAAVALQLSLDGVQREALSAALISDEYAEGRSRAIGKLIQRLEAAELLIPVNTRSRIHDSSVVLARTVD